MDSTDQPNSIYHIHSIHMYTLQSSESQAFPPFGLLVGETILHSGNCVDGVIFVTNYRLYIQIGENQYHIPLGVIELVEIRELFYLQVFCKDARIYRCTFENNESALDWYDRVCKAAEPPRQIEQLFAFYHYVWTKEKVPEETAVRMAQQKLYTFDKAMFEKEMVRMQFQGDSWRITKANENYKICPTYPPYLLVPSCINDEILESVAKFRSSRRIPAAVWRHPRNGAVIARCSQPEVGWFGWRSSEDEDLLKAISDACTFDRNVRSNSTSDKDSVVSHSPGSLHSDESLQITGEVVQQEKKLLIMDARSYTTAVANRARGGGCECPEYYPNCEIQFMNLANIHTIRKSFHALRQLCMTSADQPNWFSLLEGTRWLQHMSGLLKAAVILATAIERDARPAMVHCSDGWDRTPQIVALAELLLDPYYRTVEGFRVLIEREWLAFGHKFADRCGHSGGSDDVNERCPVFLQWLDCVHQLMTQFPIFFEFSQGYLIKLVQHTYSNLYGTFLCNTQKQRSSGVLGKTFSVWEFLNAPSFRNHLYAPSTTSAGRVLWPKTNVRDLRLWSEIYLNSMEANFSPEEGPGGACPGPPPTNGHLNMSKTRSYGDLINADAYHGLYGSRRSSDPSVNRELKLVPHEDASLLTSLDNDEDKTNHSAQIIPSINDFPSNDMDDNADCNQDCIFNLHANPVPNLTDDQLDGLNFDSISLHPRLTDRLEQSEENEEATGEDKSEVDFLAETWRKCRIDGLAGNGHDHKEEIMVDNGFKADEVSVGVSNDPSLSRNDESVGTSRDGESDICRSGYQVGKFLDMERSVETSTETLVSENNIPGSSPKEYNGFEKIRTPVDTVDSSENCAACDQNEKSNNVDYSSFGQTNGWSGAYMHRFRRRISSCLLGEDGLVPVRSPVQERLDQIMEEYKRKVELLERELHASRQVLLKQACHRCLNGDAERHDDNYSVVESLNSAGEGPISAGESLRSDLSWVDVEESSVECQGTLWVPDHAASRCTGCRTEFWLGRRRHHCRKCGKIFCADCSEHVTPLPSEQLYNPVRVCTSCYAELKQLDRTTTNDMTVSLPDRCKRLSTPAQDCPRIHQQIAASSN